MKKVLFLLAVLVSFFVIGTTESFAQGAPEVDDTTDSMVNIGLYIAYVLIIVAAVAAVVLPLVKAAGDPQSLLKTGLGVLALLAVFFIAYLISGNEVTPLYAQFDVTPTRSKIYGGGLITVYLLAAIAILGIVYTEVSSIFK